MDLGIQTYILVHMGSDIHMYIPVRMERPSISQTICAWES